MGEASETPKCEVCETEITQERGPAHKAVWSDVPDSPTFTVCDVCWEGRPDNVLEAPDGEKGA